MSVLRYAGKAIPIALGVIAALGFAISQVHQGVAHALH